MKPSSLPINARTNVFVRFPVDPTRQNTFGFVVTSVSTIDPIDPILNVERGAIVDSLDGCRCNVSILSLFNLNPSVLATREYHI